MYKKMNCMYRAKGFKTFAWTCIRSYPISQQTFQNPFKQTTRAGNVTTSEGRFPTSRDGEKNQVCYSDATSKHLADKILPQENDQGDRRRVITGRDFPF